jgi:hypothetical protein
MEPYDTPACIFRGVVNLPSTVTLKFMLVTYEVIRFIKFAEECNFIVCIASQDATWCPRLFQYPRIS